MNVHTMTVSGEEAQRKVRIYSDIPAAKRTAEDEAEWELTELEATLLGAMHKFLRSRETGGASKRVLCWG